jgi:hypothetical protein
MTDKNEKAANFALTPKDPCVIINAIRGTFHYSQKSRIFSRKAAKAQSKDKSRTRSIGIQINRLYKFSILVFLRDFAALREIGFDVVFFAFVATCLIFL